MKSNNKEILLYVRRWGEDNRTAIQVQSSNIRFQSKLCQHEDTFMDSNVKLEPSAYKQTQDTFTDFQMSPQKRKGISLLCTSLFTVESTVF
jgi:hypothetical protein